MKKFTPLLFVLTLLSVLAPAGFTAGRSQASTPEIVLMNRDGRPVTQLTDGDLVRLRITLPQKASQPTPVAFSLAGLEASLAECSIQSASDHCETTPFAALGWYWNPGGVAQGSRIVQARMDGVVAAESVPVTVSPRPVVMVHGFISNAQTWASYLGPQGYLSSVGILGFAVGDGQVAGTLDTGRIDDPQGRTNTIAENAAILGRYIAGVKELTGAQRVDLLGHSMGGLISRYYIDRLMQDDDVTQLIMLGSPMAGSECANLPAALGDYLPASLEIQPSYIEDIFNVQIVHRRGVPFFDLAGTAIQNPVASPCTPTPSDIAVSLQSVSAIPLDVTQMPIIHTDIVLLLKNYHDREDF